MLAVVSLLSLSPALRFPDQRPDRLGFPIRKEHHFPVEMPGRPTGRLDQGGFRSQIPLLVGVENTHQRHLGQIQPFPQEVDPHQHVDLPGT